MSKFSIMASRLGRWIGCFFISSYRGVRTSAFCPDTYSGRKQCCSCPANAPPFSDLIKVFFTAAEAGSAKEKDVFAVQLLQKVRSAFIGISLVRPEAHIKGAASMAAGSGSRNNRSLPAAGSRAASLPRFLCCLFCCCIRSRNS